MNVQTNVVTLGGKPVTVVGHQVNIGDPAPDFTVVNNDLADVSLGDFEGKTLIIASVHSIDTSVCATETRKFNMEAGKLGDDVKVLTISMDLPFAQKRFCAAEGIDNVMTLSDHRDASFGMNWGVLIKEHRLLARVVFIVDKTRTVRYKQVVSEVSNEPDYEDVLEALKNMG